VPEHVRELIDHAAIVRRNDVAGLDVEIRLAREDGSRRGIHAPRRLERTEAAAERDLALVVQSLAAEHEHGVLVERGADDMPRPLVHRSRDIDAADFGREIPAEACDGRGRRHGA
jgi:hypothetical protein